MNAQLRQALERLVQACKRRDRASDADRPDFERKYQQALAEAQQVQASTGNILAGDDDDLVAER